MKTVFTILMIIGSIQAHALECSTELLGQSIELIVNELAQATLTIDGEERVLSVSDSWDGHMSGLLTGKGVAISYENHFGCFRNVKLITTLLPHGNLETINFGSCGGGTTPDELCLR